MKYSSDFFLKIKKTICLCIVIIATSLIAQAQLDEHGRWQNGISEPWFFTSADRHTTEEATAAQTRWNRIGEDRTRDTSDEWAGDYSRGEGEVNMSYLRWSSNSGFTFFSVYTCLPNVTNLDYGRTLASPNLLQMYSERSTGRSVLPVNFLPVRWGERRYLIPETSIAAFCDYTAGLGAFNDGTRENDSLPWEDFFLKVDDLQKPAEGLPRLPPGYEHFIRRPIEATITAVGSHFIRRMRNEDGSYNYDLVIPVTISVGRAHGVQRGLVLYTSQIDNNDTVQVTRVGSRTSRGEIVRMLGNSEHMPERPGAPEDSDEDLPVTVGERLSTRHPRLLRTPDE